MLYKVTDALNSTKDRLIETHADLERTKLKLTETEVKLKAVCEEHKNLKLKVRYKSGFVHKMFNLLVKWKRLSCYDKTTK